MQKYKNVTIVFNNKDLYQIKYENVYVSTDTRCWYISKDDTVEVIPMYNVLLLIKQGEIEEE